MDKNLINHNKKLHHFLFDTSSICKKVIYITMYNKYFLKNYTSLVEITLMFCFWIYFIPICEILTDQFKDIAILCGRESLARKKEII